MTSQTLTTPDLKKVSELLPGRSFRQGTEHGPSCKRRLLLMGLPGTGKSAFAGSCPALIIDSEDSGRDIPNPRAIRYGPHFDDGGNIVTPTYDDYKKLLAELIVLGVQGKHPVPMIGFDTIDDLIALGQANLCKKYNVPDVGSYKSHGAGYAEVRNEIFGLYDRLWQAGYGVVMVGHLAKKTVVVNGNDTTRTTAAVSATYREAMYRRCQHVLYTTRAYEKPYLGKKTIDLGNGTTTEVDDYGSPQDVFKIRVRTPFGGDDDDKIRIPIEDELVFGINDGWDKFSAAYDAAIEKLGS